MNTIASGYIRMSYQPRSKEDLDRIATLVRSAIGFDQRRVRTGRSPHRLRGVVDQDVQRPLCGDLVGQGHHLGRVTKIDADHPQPIQPVGTVVHRREAAHGVIGESGGDGGVRTVAQQPERDVHTDLRPPTGEQGGAAGEVGPGIAFGPVQSGAVRAELVVERVDHDVMVLADVAGPRAQERARRCTGRRQQKPPQRPCR